MSFDELPPDSEPPHNRTDNTPESAQEASVQDAPPSDKTRRRRATGTGTDAASTEPTAEPKPPRTRRTRAAQPAVEAPAPPTEADSATPTVTRRRNARPAAEPAVQPPASQEAAAESSAPPARRSRRVKKADAPDAVPAAEAPAPSATEPESPAPRSRSRKRTPVGPKATVEARPPEAPYPAESPEARTADVPTDESTTPARPRTRGRSRSKRAVPGPEAAAPAPEAETRTEPSEAAAAGEAPSGRTRSRRGRGRGKREATRGEAELPETTVAEPVAIVTPPRIIDRTVGAHLIDRNGTPQIVIDNVAFPPLLFFGNVEEPAGKQRVLSEIRRAARAGIHLHSTLVELPCPLSEATQALDEIDRAVRAILDADPDGFVIPRIVFVPARGWKREYPTDIATYTDGPASDPSLTSERFWREAEHSLEALVRHLRDFEWGGRVFGYHLERGEWFQPADRGYDRSMANREAFRDWLRTKYKNNLVALRAAWYDADVQFHTAEIPPVVAKPNPQRAFFETRRERSSIDFFAFTSESTADRLGRLATALKRAADDRAIVSVCYGYTFEFGHGFSGHLDLGRLLECPDVDLICGPPSYRDRAPGGAASMPAPYDSVRLHGKLWLSEDDTKTYLAPAEQDPEDFNPRLSDRYQTDQSYARAIGRALATRTGLGFMDLWGEGWLDDDGLWDRFDSFRSNYALALADSEPRRPADVIVLVDEKSLLHIQRGEEFFRQIAGGNRELLQRSGVQYETYLQSDLLDPEFPTGARLYLFLNPYRITSEQRAAIAEKLQGGGKTLAWMFAPGSCEERPQIGGAMEESASGAIGLTLRQQEWNSEIGSRIVDTRHTITERLNPREFGVRERLNPSFYVEDPDATVLADYHGSGLPSIAVKQCGGWQSVFVGEPVLNWDLLRGICKFAGVHLWTGGEDVACIGQGWVTVHGNRDGHRAVRFPEPTAVYDVTDRRLVAEGLREHRFFLKSGATRTLCIGTLDRFRALGFPNLNVPPDLQQPSSDVLESIEPQEAPRRPEPPQAPASPPAPAGAPTEAGSPRAGTIGRSCCGMPPPGKRSARYADTRAKSWHWIGRRTVNCWRRSIGDRSRSGKSRMARSSRRSAGPASTSGVSNSPATDATW